ncbi:MAG: helix-turn-helix domain-containing protein [Bacteroidetes bacterium]|nr:helix-turn-helix domain-containing protein [Bacteroidota bacterium]
MKKQQFFYELSPEEINSLFQGLQSQLTELKQDFEPKSPTEYLTRSEVAKLLKCDLSTIHNWMRKKKLIAYGIGNRVYFKRSEVEQSVEPLNKGKEGNHD